MRNLFKANSTDSEHKSEMTFFDHLEVFRWHLFRSVIAVVLAAAVVFIFKNIVFDVIILGPSRPDFFTNDLLCKLGNYLNKPALCINNIPLKIINITVGGQFLTHIRISMIGGLLLSVPYLIFEIWKFVEPALYNNEKKVAGITIISVSLLFFFGVLLGFFMIVPLSLNFLTSYSLSDSIENTININSYISNLSSICFASGIIFELPVFTFFLSKLGLVTPQFMKKYRKHAVVAILIVSGILTPPDVMSQVLVALPLYLLYEVSIGISARVLKNKSKGNG